MAPHLGSQNLQNPEFCGLNKRFQAKLTKSKIQDSGGCHLVNSKNNHISAAVQAISTKFGMVTHFDPLDRSDRYKKSKLAAAAILKNPKIAISRQRFERSARNLAQVRKLKFPTFTNQK